MNTSLVELLWSE